MYCYVCTVWANTDWGQTEPEDKPGMVNGDKYRLVTNGEVLTEIVDKWRLGSKHLKKLDKQRDSG